MTEDGNSNLSSDCPPQRSFYATHYRSGEEIRAGDRICLDGEQGAVEFVLGSSNFPEDWAGSIDWFTKEYREGFMLAMEILGLIFQHESDEDLEFVGRKT